MALRNWRYNGFSNEKLTAELDTGAGERLIEVRALEAIPEDDRQIGREALFSFCLSIIQVLDSLEAMLGLVQGRQS